VQSDSQCARDEFFPRYTHGMRHNLPQGDVGWANSRGDYAQLAS
jgi:hypothetical protein